MIAVSLQTMGIPSVFLLLLTTILFNLIKTFHKAMKCTCHKMYIFQAAIAGSAPYHWAGIFYQYF